MPKNEGIISIHGKEYATVAYRLELFRADHPDGSITTNLVKDEDGVIIMQSTICDSAGNLLATDYAEEIRGSSNINKTSALENCSTSAHGRALALAGYNKSGTGVASADEVSVAIARQGRECADARNTLKVMDERITEKQTRAIETYLDELDGGDVLLQKMLDKAKIDHLHEMSKKLAETCLTAWEVYA